MGTAWFLVLTANKSEPIPSALRWLNHIHMERSLLRVRCIFSDGGFKLKSILDVRTRLAGWKPDARPCFYRSFLPAEPHKQRLVEVLITSLSLTLHRLEFFLCIWFGPIRQQQRQSGSSAALLYNETRSGSSDVLSLLLTDLLGSS